MADRALLIAEAGVNHNGSLDMALELVDVAAAAGVDVVKFQTFNAKQLASARAPKAAYQERLTGSSETQLQMLEKLELSPDAHKAIISRCAKKDIRFLSAPFDLDSLNLLTRTFGLDELKIGSGELTNAPLLLAFARTGCNLILSTGMATLEEVETALGVIAFGMMAEPDAVPGSKAFVEALQSPGCLQHLTKKVALLHCTSEYPAAAQDANLRAIDTMRDAFGLKVGLSDHTEGWAVTLAAVARGADIIEKHVTLDRKLPGPDHTASLDPDDLAQMVRDIRVVEASIGSGIKQPCDAELANRAVARKSLVAARPIKAGQIITTKDITTMRPGSGRSPMDYWSVIGNAADRDYAESEPLDP